MRDIKMPIRAIAHMDVAIGQMSVKDVIYFHVRRQNIDDHGIVQRDYPGAKLLAPDEFIASRIHRK